MDVGDVDLVGTGDDPLGHSATARYHKIVLREIKLLDRERHQRQKHPVPPSDARDILQERGVRTLYTEPLTVTLRKYVKERVYVGLGIAAQYLLQDALGTAKHV
jgi:hypothetical protein